MNETEIAQKLAALEQKVDAVFVSAEKTRKYFLAVLIVSVVAFIAPLIGLIFALPSFLSNYSALGSF